MKLKSSLLILTILLLNNCSKNKDESANLRPVKFIQVKSYSGQEKKTFSGTVHASLESKLSFKLAGTIEKINVSVGDQVKKGQVLAQLDSATQKIAFEEAKSALLQSSAQLKNASLSYKRLRELYEEGSASKSELDTAKAALDSATAMNTAAEQKVELAKLQVEYTQVIAPDDGTIASINGEKNENISSGYPVIDFASTGAPKIEVQVPEDLIPFVKKGSQVDIKVSSLEQNNNFLGFITEVGTATTRAISTYPVVVKFDQENAPVNPGMSAEVSIDFNFEKAEMKTMIPLSSVLDENGEKFVYVLSEESEKVAKVSKRSIEILKISDLGVEIKTGIENGEKVVTAGIHQIQDGQKVKVLDDWKEEN